MMQNKKEDTEMAAITPQLVKELRDKTDAGMGECKKALVQCDGDINAAIDFLRKAGIAKAGKRAEKATKEGKVCVAIDGNKAVIVEILCETDFVANNEKFVDFAQTTAQDVLAKTSGDGDVTAQAQEMEAENLAATFTKFGEKVVLRRALRYETAGAIAFYLHGGGKVGVMIDAEGKIDDATLLKDICMHIAAYSPSYACSCEIPESVIEHEKEIGRAQLLDQGKKPEMIDKILVGKIAKWYQEVCLIEQPWIRDDKTCLKKLYPALKINKFVRWAVGQEI